MEPEDPDAEAGEPRQGRIPPTPPCLGDTHGNVGRVRYNSAKGFPQTPAQSWQPGPGIINKSTALSTFEVLDYALEATMRTIILTYYNKN